MLHESIRTVVQKAFPGSVVSIEDGEDRKSVSIELPGDEGTNTGQSFRCGDRPPRSLAWIAELTISLIRASRRYRK